MNKIILSQRYENRNTKEIVTVIDVREDKIITNVHPRGILDDEFHRIFTMKPSAVEPEKVRV